MIPLDGRDADGELGILIQLGVLREAGSTQPVTCLLCLDFLFKDVLGLR